MDEYSISVILKICNNVTVDFRCNNLWLPNKEVRMRMIQSVHDMLHSGSNLLWIRVTTIYTLQLKTIHNQTQTINTTSYTYTGFNGHFPGKPGLASCPFILLLQLFGEPLGITAGCFLQARCPSCQPTNSVKALQGTQINNTATESHPLASCFLDPIKWHLR